MDYNTEHYVTWDDIQSHCRALARRIIAQKLSRGKILAITRGGLFPAGILARELDIRHIETVCIDTYDLQNRKEPTLLKPPAPDFRQDVLVVDDLADTGATLKLLRDMLTDCTVVTLFAKPDGAALVDLYHQDIAQDVWVRFPWDTYRQYVKPLAHGEGA